ASTARAMAPTVLYDLGDKLHESARAVVYRGRRRADGLPVVIKALASDHPSREDVARLKREHEVTTLFSCDGVIKSHGVERFGDKIALILEDFGAISLRAYLAARSPGLEEVLEIAACVA